MRAKKDSLQIQFAGQPQSQNIELPRSLAHAPRVPILHQPPPPRPSYTNPGQQHVLQQQQLQEQLQQGRVGPPMINRPGPQYHPQASTSQGPPHPQQQQPGQSPYPQNLPHPLQAQNYQHPSRPGSAQSSPNLSHAPHPYGNGRPPPPQQSIGVRGGPQDPAFTQALAAIGLAGRNIEDLNPEEQATFELHMRRIGQLPSLQGQQQVYRRGPQPPPAQRMTVEQHRIQQHLIQQQQQQQQLQLQQQLQQRGQYAPPPPPPAAARISPSNSGRVQDPSPRQRKRQRPSKEDNSTGGETPRFDVSGPPSPANSQFPVGTFRFFNSIY